VDKLSFGTLVAACVVLSLVAAQVALELAGLPRDNVLDTAFPIGFGGLMAMLAADRLQSK
jgi:hypothetical protein